MTSDKVVHGSDTLFLKELEIGDKIIVHNSSNDEVEERQITMVLGNKSCGIDEPFTNDIRDKSEFKY